MLFQVLFLPKPLHPIAAGSPAYPLPPAGYLHLSYRRIRGMWTYLPQCVIFMQLLS